MSDKDSAGKTATEQKPAATETKTPAGTGKSATNSRATKNTKANTAPGKSDSGQQSNTDSYQIGRRVWPD